MKEERFSSGTPSKNKISNFGAISPLYPNFIYHSLSLTLSLNLKKNERTEKKKDIYVHGEFNYDIFDTLKVYIIVVKDSCILMLPRGLSCSLQFCYEFVTSCFLFSFYSPYVILLRILLLIPLKYHTGNRSCRQLQYNIITTKPIGPYLPLSRGGRKATWWVCG